MLYNPYQPQQGMQYQQMVQPSSVPQYAYSQPVVPQQVQMQPQQPTQTSAPIQPQPESLMNGGFIVVPSEEDVRRYPVAPGNFVTFRIENQPILVEKSMGRSQFASPHYERYKLVREGEDSETGEENKSIVVDGIESMKEDMSHLSGQIESMKDDLMELKRYMRNGKMNRKETGEHT